MGTTAAIYRTSISHVRCTPLHNAFTYRSYRWYVDVDKLQSVPWPLRPLAEFRVSDHLGDPAGSFRGNVERFLQTRGIELDGGRITMLASARVFGYVFNPLSLFWCHDQGILRFPLQRPRRPVPHETPGTGGAPRRLHRPRA
jgi:uncharacterized protein